MKLLHVDAGITGPGSVSRQLSAAIVEALVRADPSIELATRDLDADPIPHLDGGSLGLRPADDAAAAGAAILDQFLDADVVVLGAPMYNFSIPSQLKAWFDRILIAGKTFRYTADGPKGLVEGKTVIIASARGGFYAPDTPGAAADHHEPLLRTMFALIGVTDLTIVRAEGVAVSPEQRAAAIEAALAAVPEAATRALAA